MTIKTLYQNLGCFRSLILDEAVLCQANKLSTVLVNIIEKNILQDFFPKSPARSSVLEHSTRRAESTLLHFFFTILSMSTIEIVEPTPMNNVTIRKAAKPVESLVFFY